MSLATSNEGKFREVSLVLHRFGVNLERLPGKGVEIQSDDLGEVANFAAAEAARAYRRPLIVEDTGLLINRLNGFPGTYTSFVFRSIGLDGVLKLLVGTAERRARFESAVAYCEPDGEPRLFRGSVRGRITKSASGREGFGFDPIFVPDGRRVTLAEMKIEEKCEISHRAAATTKFGAWYVHQA